MSQSQEISKRRQKTAAKRDLISIGNDLIHVAIYYQKKYAKLYEKVHGDSKPLAYQTSIALESKVKTKTGRDVTERQVTVFTDEEAEICFAKLKEHFVEAVDSFVEINKRTANREHQGAGGLVTVGMYSMEFSDYYGDLDTAGVTPVLEQDQLDVIINKSLCTPMIVKRVLRLDWMSVRKEGEKLMYVTPRMKKFLPNTLAACKASGMNLEEFTYAQMGRLASKVVVPKTELTDADKEDISNETYIDLLKGAYSILKPKDEDAEEVVDEPVIKPVTKATVKQIENGHAAVKQIENGHAAEPTKPVEKKENKPEPAAPVPEASVRRPRQRRQGTDE